MNRRQAEAVTALFAELSSAEELQTTGSAERTDWMLQFAAERVIERIFQAAEALDEQSRDRYFGLDALRYLRGMRNRLAHNYLNVDAGILWRTIDDDLPVVRSRMIDDATEAAAILKSSEPDRLSADAWRRVHLAPIDATDGN